ncbi:SubName: Full=Uncharacterized protein {ECO:0000313/EMBL:CCA68016.1} [Serendipita indica DSM 11827]|uniref:CBM1 domain-containing protein n=1 Tax=Serendipita indica (strain DSM 11827) TaxID=1109443 RepID=G4T9P5_SERID|nr:SubName: Full=Uncharacterized protein {ECO:0000313/EMBL:CCA68016.1} [Serendipita indica DSM 11827]CCA68016.1 hypothetical protein PIIN_01883 [Serendipita indica DSM 11827]
MVQLWSLLSVVLYITLVTAVPLWGQCGGQGYSGSTVCDAGSYCNAYNPFYSQCIPLPSGSSSSSSVSRSTVTSASTVSRSTVTFTSTSSSATPTSSGVQIRGVSSPVYHLYLQSLGGVPVLGPQSSGGYFTINGSIKLNNASPALYLNIASSSTSYKALTFSTSPTFTGWGLEGDTIVTVTGSLYGRQLNFLACPSSTSGYYQLYLQTGNDTPSSSCTLQTIHLPCLC